MSLKQKLGSLNWKSLKYRGLEQYRIAENGILVHPSIGFVDPKYNWSSSRLEYELVYKDGTEKFFPIHKLVADHFVIKPNIKLPPEDHWTIDHIDENPWNNHYTNLAHMPYSENWAKGQIKNERLNYGSDKERQIYRQGIASIIRLTNQWFRYNKKYKYSWIWADFYKIILETPEIFDIKEKYTIAV